MKYSPIIESLILSFTALPGVGAKTAQRMVFHLLERNRQAGMDLSVSLAKAMQQIKHCEQCHNFTEEKLCTICKDLKRGNAKICVVENPQDVIAIEESLSFSGRYFVLMGHLSPLDGIGPEDINIDKLNQLLKTAAVQELILATSATVEGEATAYYIADIARNMNIKATRIALGLPIGGELEHVDPSTVARALSNREEVI